jgi:methylmalonyl-CoA/ethylmalonyl-CoA epimerase
MLDLRRIDHVSQVTADPGPVIDLYERLFGFELSGSWEEDREGYRGVNLAVPGRSGIGWEILSPTRADSFVQRFLDSPLGPGLHHVTLQVPSVADAARELQSMGIEPWGGPENEGADWDEVFIHPRDGHGFLFQITGTHAEAWHRPPPLTVRPGALEVPPTLGIIAINHLSHAHPRREELAAWYELVFGMMGIYAADGTDGPFATAVLESPTQQMRWEVLQPYGEGSFVHRFLQARGPAMHHVAFQVGDWQRALNACVYNDVPVFGLRDGVTDGALWHEAFIHPRFTGGVLVQFFWEERPGIWI